jgi:DNA-directed RNA polymerase I, II, and III subunit RPABC3
LGKVREKKFDRVSRLVAESLQQRMRLTLDVHSQLFPVRAGDRFLLVLMSSVRLDGAPCDGTYDQSGAPTVINRYDYVMCGKVFHQESEGAHQSAVCISFGGLLMRLQGSRNVIDLADLRLDNRVYLLLRRV